jgi:hypothetical protein
VLALEWDARPKDAFRAEEVGKAFIEVIDLEESA